jgi:arsenite oxidase small subunit
MTLEKSTASRRDFLKASVAASGALGILAFPPGITQAIDTVSASVSRVTQTYPRLRIVSVSDLVEGETIDFQYPLQEHNNLLVKLGTTAFLGVGPDSDIVAFSYSCAHMGCPLNGMFKSEHNVLGPCPCHFSQFDLAKSGILSIGQATQSLPQVLLETDGSGVFATGVTGLLYGHWNNLAGGTEIAES